MANEEHLAILKKGIEAWNAWRNEHKDIIPDLIKADLTKADLTMADLHDAQLQGANLFGAQLQGALLGGAQLQGANLSEAGLGGTQLQGASLFGAKLQEALLGGAQLQGAWLERAQLQGADLREAILEGGWSITEDGQPEDELSAADLTDANLRDADLSNAKLSTVTSLRAERLGGSVLMNATLPEDIRKFDRLKHVEETSRHAGTTFVALWGASLYSWLTIATTTDVQLVTDRASSPLPIINTAIPLAGFYLAAPLILLGVYFYLHLYLQRLWRDLAALPARFP